MAGFQAQRILIVCPGSQGDLDPFLAVALYLLRAGHEVTIGTLYRYAHLVRAIGARFAPSEIPISAGASEDLLGTSFETPEIGPRLFRERIVDRIPDMIEVMQPFVAASDICVTQSFSFSAQLLAEASGRPWLSAVLSPYALASRISPPHEPRHPGLPTSPSEWTELYRQIMRPYHVARHRLALPRVNLPAATYSRQGVLALFSRHFAHNPGDWPPRTVAVGYSRHVPDPEPADWARAMAFLAAGPPPIVLTLGSQSATIGQRFFRSAIAAVRRLGLRALTLGMTATEIGEVEGVDLACFSSLPFGRIFAHARAVVCHSGMGTMARALEAGRPLLAVPSPVSDQPDNAIRARRLGVAVVVPLPAFDTQSCTAALGHLLGDPRYELAARALALALKQEGDGAPRAAALILAACRPSGASRAGFR